MQKPVELARSSDSTEELKKVLIHLQDTATRESSNLSAERRRAALQDEVALLRTSLVEHFRMEEDGGTWRRRRRRVKGTAFRVCSGSTLRFSMPWDAHRHACRSGGASGPSQWRKCCR